MYLFLAALGLTLVVASRAYSPVAGRGFLFVVASPVAAHRLQGVQASVVVVRRLTCPEACGVFLEQGSNPCPLLWEADSRPLGYTREAQLLIS